MKSRTPSGTSPSERWSRLQDVLDAAKRTRMPRQLRAVHEVKDARQGRRRPARVISSCGDDFLIIVIMRRTSRCFGPAVWPPRTGANRCSQEDHRTPLSDREACSMMARAAGLKPVVAREHHCLVRAFQKLRLLCKVRQM